MTVGKVNFYVLRSLKNSKDFVHIVKPRTWMTRVYDESVRHKYGNTYIIVI